MEQKPAIVKCREFSNEIKKKLSDIGFCITRELPAIKAFSGHGDSDVLKCLSEQDWVIDVQPNRKMRI